MTITTEVARLLGYENERRVETPLDLVPLIRKGLRQRDVRVMLKSLATTLGDVSGMLQDITQPRGPNECLSPHESERVLRTASIALRAKEVFGQEEKACRWLNTPSRALGSQTPGSLLDTAIGAREVEDELLRIEYGVFS